MLRFQTNASRSIDTIAPMKTFLLVGASLLSCIPVFAGGASCNLACMAKVASVTAAAVKTNVTAVRRKIAHPKRAKTTKSTTK